MPTRSPILVIAFVLALPSLFGQADPIGTAVAALQQGNYSAAQQILEARLHTEPNDSEALAVLAVVLDQEKNFTQADPVYRHALKLLPRDPSLWNNYGNHLISSAKPSEARKAFVEVVTLQPDHANALVQLARLAVESKMPAEAIRYLDRLPSPARSRPDASILRMQADYRLGRQAEADAILQRLSLSSGTDPAQSFQLGVALSSVGEYDKAEALFSQTLQASPENFDALYDLGLAASHAGHNERARDVLQQLVSHQPENVDALCDLAAVDVALGNREPALQLLAKATRLAPQRADVLQLEARTSASLGYFADAAQTWDAYLKLKPTDDIGRRERAFAQTATGGNMASALAELHAFVRNHPADPEGHYELGTAETPQQPDDALRELDRALALKPDLTAAHVARGLLLYRQGKTEAARADFEFAARREPNNGAILDRLGEIEMALNQPAEALPTLRKAAELSPDNSAVLLHLARALSQTGHQQEASAAFARCRELGPTKAESPHPAGLVEFLGLSPRQQLAQYRAGVERILQTSPSNPEAHVRYLGILLEDGQIEKTTAEVHTLCNFTLTAPVLAEAVRMLLTASQYALAKQILDQNSAINSAELSLDRGLAEFHLSGPVVGLTALDRVPPTERTGDFYLARALMLESQGAFEDADLSLRQAIRTHAARPELYCQAALLEIKHQQLPPALQLLEQGVYNLPDDPEIALLQAMTLELSGGHTAVDVHLKRLEERWPEWYKVWLAHALILQVRHQPQDAQRMRQTALALATPPAFDELGQSPSFSKEDLGAILPTLFP